MTLRILSVSVLAAALFAQGGFVGPGRYTITNLKSGRTLGVDPGDRASVPLDAMADRNSTPVMSVRSTGSPSQQWRIEPGKDGNAIIICRLGRGLDIPGGSDRPGTRVQTYGVNGDSNQRFVLAPVGRAEARRPIVPPPPGPVAPRIVRCDSEGRRIYCEADTRFGVRMVRQHRGGPCELGQTWGYDRRGSWVDRGCRADFELGVRR